MDVTTKGGVRKYMDVIGEIAFVVIEMNNSGVHNYRSGSMDAYLEIIPDGWTAVA